ncbi:hypothetical protein [Dysgonomonas reticulitermitis]
MKKILSIFLLLSLSFAFSACGGSDDDEPEKFVWGGDWNDPNDPHYATYKGMYNPIQGLWRFDWDTERGIYFSEDFIAYNVVFYPNGLYKKESIGIKYIINDKAFSFVPAIQIYEIEGTKLKYKGIIDEKERWSYCTRVEE